MSSAMVEAPFPWFGAKSRVASEVWRRFGNVSNYVEPLCGSCAVLLGRPHEPRTETVNDADGLLVNFLRSASSDPDAVAYHADWPVSECDLHARHAYLVERIPWLTDRLMGDPSFCVPKMAGWWVWGACAWIGTGWCSGRGPWVARDGVLFLREDLNKQLPHLGTGGCGVNKKLPHLGDAGSPSLNASDFDGEWTAQGQAVRAWIRRLQDRLRLVRIVCGDWTRVVTPVVTWRHGTTAVFFDPPYAAGEMEYSAGSGKATAEAVREWCLENGDDPRLRIALCGHEGEHDLPGWTVYRWKARGGYGNQGGEDSEDLRHREVILFSPHCLGGQGTLFEGTSPAISERSSYCRVSPPETKGAPR